MHKV